MYICKCVFIYIYIMHTYMYIFVGHVHVSGRTISWHTHIGMCYKLLSDLYDCLEPCHGTHIGICYNLSWLV